MATPESVVNQRSMSIASELVSSVNESDSILSLKGSSRRKKGAGGIFKSTAQPDSPSITASIPSKYQTFFVPSREQQGFNSCTSRFDSTAESVNDNPGPGTYKPDEPANWKRMESFSKKGTGGLASRTKRFPRHTRGFVGPGSYNLTPFSSHVDFNRSQFSRNFQSPVAKILGVDQRSLGPAPNSYNVNCASASVPTAVSAFKSKTKRAGISQMNSDNPGPGQYSPKDAALHRTVCTQKANFLSKTRREQDLIQHKDFPGPADYYATATKTTEKRPVPYHRQKHYLCISAPAIPLPPIPPPPGPGHYEVPTSNNDTQLVSGAVFKSTSSRWSRPNDSEIPGPGTYDPRTTGKQSFFYNINQYWV